MFLISALVPKGTSAALAPGAGRLRMDTFASTRMDPSSMLQSLMPSVRKMSRSFCAKRRASSGVRMSGSVTSSMSGVPARLKSTSDSVAPPMRPSVPPRCTILPVSSSRWMRVIPMGAL